jgi:hypothetical protein
VATTPPILMRPSSKNCEFILAFFTRKCVFLFYSVAQHFGVSIFSIRKASNFGRTNKFVMYNNKIIFVNAGFKFFKKNFIEQH